MPLSWIDDTYCSRSARRKQDGNCLDTFSHSDCKQRLTLQRENQQIASRLFKAKMISLDLIALPSLSKEGVVKVTHIAKSAAT